MIPFSSNEIVFFSINGQFHVRPVEVLFKGEKDFFWEKSTIFTPVRFQTLERSTKLIKGDRHFFWEKQAIFTPFRFQALEPSTTIIEG